MVFHWLAAIPQRLRVTPSVNQPRRNRRSPSPQTLAAEVSVLERRIMLTVLSANITTSQTLSQNSSLTQDIHITNGATLTVTSGITITGHNFIVDNGGSLVSTSGANIFGSGIVVSNGGSVSLSGATINTALQLNSGAIVPTLSGNTFAANVVTVDPSFVPALAGNTFSPSSTVYLYGSTISTSLTFENLANVNQYQFNANYSSIQVNNGGNLIFASGTTLANYGSNILVVNNGGTLTASSANFGSGLTVTINNGGTIASSGTRYDAAL